MARFLQRARMHKPDEFKAVFERGRRVNESPLTAVIAENQAGWPRLGLAVAKKSIPDATDRNRIKRHIRESFRLNQQRLPGMDIIILPKPAAMKLPPAQLREALHRLWTRIAESCAALPSS
jgi:ribonuclease P protein component